MGICSSHISSGDNVLPIVADYLDIRDLPEKKNHETIELFEEIIQLSSKEEVNKSKLLEVISECPDYKKSLIKYNLPFEREILNGTFTVEDKSLADLFSSLMTFSYHGIDSTHVVKEIVWILGEDKKTFMKYFIETDGKYSVRKDIDKVIYCEFKRAFPKEYDSEELSCKFDKKYLKCKKSAEYGNIRLLKWLRSEGFSWDEWSCAYAAKNGQFDTLKWLRSEGCPWDEFSCEYATKNGHYEILKWLVLEGCPFDEDTCIYAIKNKNKKPSHNLDILKWLKLEKYHNKFPLNASLYAHAASNGNLDILKWLRSEGCPWDEWSCAYAAYHGHFDTLKWLRSEGCPWDERTCYYAVKNKHFDILKWARSEGCPWDGSICDYAAAYGQYDILKWLINNGCPHLEEHKELIN